MGRIPTYLPRPLAATARAQHGCFTLAQAVRCGVPEWRVRTLIAVGLLDAIDPGVLRLTAAPRTEDQRVWVAYLAVGDPSGACAETGAWLLGWSGFALPDRPQFGVPNNRQPRTQLADVRHLARWAPPPAVRNGPAQVPVLSPADLVVTLARDSSSARVLKAIQVAVFSSGLNLFDVLARTGRGVAGSARIRSAVATYVRGHDSEPELRTYVTLSRARLAPDHTNVYLVGSGGRVGPVDGYYECGIAYEYDGRAAHSGYAQRQVDVSKRQRIRDQRVDVVPLDARLLAAPMLLVRTVREAVGARAAASPPQVVVEHSSLRSCVCGWVPVGGAVPILSTGA